MKRLVVCLDGTWNTPDEGPNPTNVVKVMRAVRLADKHGVPQIAFYDKGVGTGGPIDAVRGGAFGRGLADNVCDGFRFLCNNYIPGDEIYLFGFSRGAYTARSLAGFIGWMGLLEKEAMGRLKAAWRTYKEKDADGRERIRRAHGSASSREVPVKCVGVWDTVGALGVPGKLGNLLTKDKYRFHDTGLGPHIEYGFHALAIDEKRGPFAPTLWSTAAGNAIPPEQVKQVWFPGVHSNVGGSYADARLSDLALAWMIGEVERATDLEFDPEYAAERVAGDPLGTLYESRGPVYVFSRATPFVRVLGGAAVERSWLNRLLGRANTPPEDRVYVNEMIHWSALARLGQEAPWQGGGGTRGKEYLPGNLRAAAGALPVVEADGSVRPPADAG